MGDREERAEKITKYLIRSWNEKRRKLYFLVLVDRLKGEEIPFECHWKRKNIRGVVFEPDDLAGAEAWIKQALLAGYTVHRAWSKTSGGAGRGLADGLPWDWDDERGCWDLDPESVGRRQAKGMG